MKAQFPDIPRIPYEGLCEGILWREGLSPSLDFQLSKMDTD